MDNVITIDLLEPDYFQFEMFESEDPNQSSPFNKELYNLTRTSDYLPMDGIVYLDQWAQSLFLKVALDKIREYRELLRRLFIKFLASEMFAQLCKRYNLTTNEMLLQSDEKVMLDWLVFWTSRSFPFTAKLFFKREDINKLSFLSEITSEQIIAYLPKFALWHLGRIAHNKNGRRIILPLAKGHSIRQERTLPICFSKKMAHHFANAPHTISLKEAIWYAYVKGLGGDLALVNALYSVFKNWFRSREFLDKIILFFANNKPVNDHKRLCKLLGYLRHLHDETPGFSMKGWTLKSCQRRSDEWYALIEAPIYNRRSYPAKVITWEGTKYQPFEKEIDEITYSIVQLTSSTELAEESRRMSHCVRLYAGRCMLGNASIWSLRQIEGNSTIIRATIEVQKDHKIVQVKAKRNASPDQDSMDMIRLWAEREDLDFGLVC